MIFSRPIEEIIRMRHSVRNYTSERIPIEVSDEIFTYIKSVDNFFQGDVSIYLINKDDLPKSIKLSTHGMVKGANSYLIGVSGDAQIDKISLGYVLEKVVLYLTDLGLGTVWLGGTFNRAEFLKTVSILGHHKVRVVIPFGYKGGRKSLLGKMAGGNHNKRKDFKKILFDGNTQQPMDIKETGIFELPLEMFRLAPSGLNKQPWACGIKKNEVDFYIIEDTKVSEIDIGIGISHFLLTCEEHNIKGKFEKLEKEKNTRRKYIGTFRIKESV